MQEFEDNNADLLAEEYKLRRVEYSNRIQRMNQDYEIFKSKLSHLNTEGQSKEKTAVLEQIVRELQSMFNPEPQLEIHDFAKARFVVPNPSTFPKYFRVMQELGIEHLFPGTIVLPEQDWQTNNPEDLDIQGSGDIFKPGIRKKIGQRSGTFGIQIRSIKFPANSLFANLGLKLLSSSCNENEFVHEDLHQIDAFDTGNNRQGINGIITELLTHRADIMASNGQLTWGRVANRFKKHYISLYGDTSSSIEEQKQKVDRVIEAIIRLDQILPKKIITKILLLSKTLDEILLLSNLSNENLIKFADKLKI
jgi:hypothetical protein